MFRVVLLSCVLPLVLAGHFVKIFDPCMVFTNTNGMKCAKKNVTLTNSFGMGRHTDDLKECYPPKGKPLHYFTCVAFKKGYLADDGSIDRKALSEIMKKDFKNEPGLAEKINKNCVNADLSHYYEKKYYRKLPELRKIEFCVELQSIMYIDEWDDEGACHGIKALIDDCTKGLNIDD